MANKITKAIGQNKSTVALILVVGMLIAFHFGVIPMPLSVVGASVLSCDNAEYKSSDPNYIDGSLFCTMALTGSGQTQEFIFDNTFVQQMFGVQTEKVGNFKATMDGSLCSYRFMNESNFAYRYDVRHAVTQKNGYYVCKLTATEIANIEQTTGTKYLGYTPIKCTNVVNSCLADTQPVVSGCDYVFRKTEGTIYRLDPSIFNDFEAKLEMTIDGQTETATLSQTNPTERTDFFTAEYLGGLQGQQTCPAQPSTSGFIANAMTINPVQYHDRFLADAVIQDQLTLTDVSTIVSRANAHNAMLDQYLASSPSTGQYCSISTTVTTTANDAKISCRPVGTTNVPLFNLYVSADKMEIVKPSGDPQILNVSVGKVEAATRSEVIVKATNTGEGDSFDFSVQCPHDINPFTAREFLNTNEIKEVKVSYEGAGLIEDCTITMKSVNSPDKVDTTTAKLDIKPFCPRSPPSSAHTKVFTSKGCAYICENYGSKDASGNVIDVFDANCQRINNNVDTLNEAGKLADYDRCDYQNGTCIQKRSYAGIHCTGLGTYTYTDRYMDEVAKEKTPFAPEKQPNRYFIVSVDGRAVCNYLDEYGYSDGVPVDNLVFDYNQGFGEASQSSEVETDPGVPQIPVSQTAGDSMQTYLIIAGVIIVGAGVVFYMSKKRRR